LKGDEEKIRQRIAEWWEEPIETQEPEWEDVNKRSALKKKPTQQLVHGGSRGGGGGGSGVGSSGPSSSGRGGRGGRGGGGRGDRRDSRNDRGDRPGGRGGGRTGRGDRARQSSGPRHPSDGKPESKSDENQARDENPPLVAGVPPVGNVRAPQGAWAKKTAPEPTPHQPKPPAAEPVAPQAPVPAADPTPISAPPPAPAAAAKAPAVQPVPAGGNVWATRGSAHLIQAEKPKPPAPPAPKAPAAPKASAKNGGKSQSMPTAVRPPESPRISATPAAPAVASPASNAWKQASAEPSLEMGTSVGGIGVQPASQSAAGKANGSSAKASRPKQANVLNMGHWETGDADDGNMDFGFGSFGNDVADGGAATSGKSASAAASQETPQDTGASPARPPPGLSIGGMPPMPANAVLVHELEGKLDGTSLSGKPGTSAGPSQGSSLPQPGSARPMDASSAGAAGPATSHSAGVATSAPPGHQGYNQYGGMGMYPGNTGFMAIPGGTSGGTGPMLGAGALPQQQQSLPGGPKVDPLTATAVAAGGLYGSAPSSGGAPAPGATNAPAPGATNDTSTSGMPPGMPNMYAQPGMYYGQQPYHMGQHQGGPYNYGYGAQFGGAVQGGYGYPQAMGQSGGYGHGPHYDDQSGHSGGSGGGYQKNSGRYGGRNSHHNNNQYQNQYNPQQHGGYGGQPYGGMGYGDFNRGGYGGMQDPYGMPQPPQQGLPQGGGGGGFQDDKGKKGGGRGLGQFQQQGPPAQLGGGGQQHPFGLHGQAGSNSNQQTAGGGGGWSNQQSGGGTGGGWSGSTSNWQGGK